MTTDGYAISFMDSRISFTISIAMASFNWFFIVKSIVAVESKKDAKIKNFCQKIRSNILQDLWS